MPKITITELAKQLGVSVCTVNKALSGKPKVSEKTRQRVIDEAARLGYRPNRMAQVLARKPIKLAYVHANHFPSFFKPLEAGVARAVDRLADQRVSHTVHAIDPSNWEKGLAETINLLVDDGLSGLILSPISDIDYAPVWNVLEERRIPLVQLGLEVAGSPAVLTVRQDTLLSCHMAAELLSLFSGPAAVLIGSRQVVDHEEKLRGFEEEAERRHLRVAAVCEHEDKPKLAYRMTRNLLRAHPDLCGLYVATDNFEGVARALVEEEVLGRVKVVATGLFPEIQAAMDAGMVHFTLDQRMVEQGEMAVQQLHELLSQHPLPSDKILLPPRIAVRGNVEYLAGKAAPCAPAE